MATILIVEDELLIAAEIERILYRLGHKPLEPVDNSDGALSLLAQHPVELVLMDINIAGDCDGIATALMIRRQFSTPVVFLTARSDATTVNRAKLAHPYGYVLKPFTEQSLRAQIEVALFNANQSPPPPQLPAPPVASEAPTSAPLPLSGKYVFIRKGAGHVKVMHEDILYFEALQNYVRLHTATESYVFDYTLKVLEQQLPDHFFKTHRSHIVNLDHVQAYEEGYVLLGKDNYVPVSRSCKEELKNRLFLLG